MLILLLLPVELVVSDVFGIPQIPLRDLPLIHLILRYPHHQFTNLSSNNPINPINPIGPDDRLLHHPRRFLSAAP